MYICTKCPVSQIGPPGLQKSQGPIFTSPKPETVAHRLLPSEHCLTSSDFENAVLEDLQEVRFCSTPLPRI